MVLFIDSTAIGCADVRHTAYIGLSTLAIDVPFVGKRIIFQGPGYLPIDVSFPLRSSQCESRLFTMVRACAALLPNFDETCIDYSVVTTFRAISSNTVKIYMRSVEPSNIEHFPSIDAMVRVAGMARQIPWFYVRYIPHLPHDFAGMAYERTLPLQMITVEAPTACCDCPGR